MQMGIRYNHQCEIWLRPRPCSSASNYDLTIVCQLMIPDGKSFSESNSFSDSARGRGGIRLWGKDVGQDIRPSGRMEEWTVLCLFKDSGKPFSLRVENKTINLSVDKNVDKSIQVSSEIPLDAEALSSDIFSLLHDGILPDFKLKCGDRTFPVHRSVLAARSEVFRAMMRNRMQESETGSVDISDLEISVVESLLKFLYSGKLDDFSVDTAPGLCQAADKYAVHSLRAACSYWMVRNLTEDNCVSYLRVSDSHSDAGLKAAAMTFILDHPRVFKGSAWMEFAENHMKQAFEVLQAYAASTIQRDDSDDSSGDDLFGEDSYGED